MPDTIEPLLRDLLLWLGEEGRPYPEVMDAWRTSCPRLPVWEEANERGLVVRSGNPGLPTVRVTQAGRNFLQANSLTA